MYHLTNRTSSAALFACMAASMAMHVVHGQYTDVSSMLNIQSTVATTYNGNGLSFYDFNQDGWDDVTIGRGNLAPVFLVNNQGNLSPAPFAIPNNDGKQIMMIMWVDYDSDGDLDLFISKMHGPLELWQNDGNFNFVNVAAAAGLDQASWYYTGAAWCDYDHDGDLDLYVAKFYHPSIGVSASKAPVFYINNGDGTFTESTVDVGLWLPQRPMFQPVFLDYDNDGWEDLYLITDRVFVENVLFKNNKDGTFSNVTLDSGAGLSICAMSGTVGDYDNDGDLDVYMTNTWTVGSKLLRNNGNSTFTEVAAAMGVNTHQVGWGSMWLDYDNDGWLDLFAGLTGNGPGYAGNHFYHNQQGNGFVNVVESIGMLNEVNETFVAAMGDLNNDGYTDILLNNKEGYLPKLYQNTTAGNNYLSVSLKGTYSNTEGVGSWITCYAGGHAFSRFSLCGENLIGQNANRYIFGLDSLQLVDSLVVRWNRGSTDVLYQLDVNQHITVIEGLSVYMQLGPTASSTWLCPGDSVELHMHGHPNALWSNGAQGESTMVNAPGLYYATLGTPQGYTVNTQTIEIVSAPTEAPHFAVSHESCYGAYDGAISLEGDSEQWTSIVWSNGLEQLSLSNLTPGAITYHATDAYGCPHTGSVQITAAEALVGVVMAQHVRCHGGWDGAAQVAVFGGVPPYTLEWDEGVQPDSLAAGWYEVLITDAHLCTDVATVLIAEPEAALQASIDIAHIEVEGGSGSAWVWPSGGTPPYALVWSGGEAAGSGVTGLGLGAHHVLISDVNAYTTQLDFEVYNTTAAYSMVRGSRCTIVPNPVKRVFSLQHCSLQGRVAYSIHDVGGRTLQHGHFDGSASQLSVEMLDRGMYFLWLDLPDGAHTYGFVKEGE